MAAQREWFEKDYYKVLGVAKTATDKDDRARLRKLAKQYHPDANPGSEERFKEISAAYDVLGDQAKRKEYDEVRTLSRERLRRQPVRRRRCREARAGFYAISGLTTSATCSATFSAGAAAGPSAPSGRTRPARSGARTSRPSLHLSFADAVTGCHHDRQRDVGGRRARPAAASGAAPGTAPTVCPVCGGRGVINENQGMFSFSHPCVACSGTGMRVEVPCPTCKGRGTERRARQVKVRIPAGVEDGQRIRVRRTGAAPAATAAPPATCTSSCTSHRTRFSARRART